MLNTEITQLAGTALSKLGPMYVAYKVDHFTKGKPQSWRAWARSLPRRAVVTFCSWVGFHAAAKYSSSEALTPIAENFLYPIIKAAFQSQDANLPAKVEALEAQVAIL